MKGIIKLYDSKDQVVDTSFYKDKKERKVLVNAWTKRCYGGEGYYFIIYPFAEFRLPPTQQVYFYNLRHKPKAEIKIPLIRPIAIYNNSPSPYGISDELHKYRKNKI